MSTEKPAPDKKPTPIAVRAIHFNRANGISIPVTGKQVTSLDTRPKMNGDGYEIHLLPWLRHYQVRITPSNKALAPFTILIPEDWAIAELAE